jgi:hypothetical protein
MYNYYGTIIFLLCILYIRKLWQKNFKIIFQFFSQIFLIIFYIIITNCSYQMKVFNLKHSLVHKQKKLNKKIIKLLNAY